MTDLSETSKLISELANTWDPEKEAEAYSISAFLQGVLAATCMDEMITHVKTKTVETPQRDGTYERFFTVVTESGHRIRVTVEPEVEPKFD